MNVKEMKNKLIQASDSYYNTDKKAMSDQEFDTLKDQYESLSGEKFQMGATPRDTKGLVDTAHEYGELVGSLDKINTMEEYVEWLAKKNPNWGAVAASLKFDGNALVTIYNPDGTLKQAVTRGDRDRVVDLTHVFSQRVIKNPTGKEIAIKNEVVMTYPNFDRLQSDHGLTYANPRSLVSGKLHDKHAADFAEYFTLIPLDVTIKGVEMSRVERIKLVVEIAEQDPDVMLTFKIMKDPLEALSWLNDFYKEAGNYRLDTKFPFMIDGIVLELLDDARREELGVTSDRPNYAIALKFPYMEKASKIIDIQFDYGLTGQITPVAVYDTVVMNGSNYRRTSLANYKRFQDLGLGIGSDVLIQLRNEVLCYVEALDTPHNKTVEPFPFIENCPLCGEKITLNTSGALAFCINPECEGKLTGRITRFLAKTRVKGISGGIVDKLIENGTITDLKDLFNMKAEDCSYLGDVMSVKVIDLLHGITGTVEDFEILGGIGIQDFSRSGAKLILKEYDIEGLITLAMLPIETFMSKMLVVDGIAEMTAEKIYEGLNKYWSELLFLTGMLRPKVYKDQFQVAAQTYNLCITGTLNRYKRNDLKDLLEKKGHKVSSGVTGKTDFLVNNDVHSTSSKNKKAQSLGKEILTEDQMIERLGL